MKSVTFLVHPEDKYLGSSVLRADQLCKICSSLFADEDYRFSVSYEFRKIREQLVVLSKSFLVKASSEDLRLLHLNRNFLAADWLDYKIRDDISSILDAFISSSRAQNLYFKQKFLTTPVVNITHHVDLRIPDVRCLDDKLRIGYFGNYSNARFYDLFESSIDLINAWDANDSTWIAKLNNYNCHYIVRKSNSWDGLKPFTKGFIAAHCGAVVIADRDDAEAVAYVGEDYPFLFTINTREDFCLVLGTMRKAFKSSAWYVALKKMEILREATSPFALKAELRNLLLLGEHKP